jgi:peptidoglycan-N-acetylglucosamine deacetylase
MGRRSVGRAAGGRRASPFRNFSKHSLRYLLETGFGYDSSLMGDDIPYALRDSNASLLEFPVDWTLDDFPHYAHEAL